jgi:hypothetical protein
MSSTRAGTKQRFVLKLVFAASVSLVSSTTNPFRKTTSSKSCSTTARYAVRGAPAHQISTISDCPDILDNCGWVLLSAMVILMLQQPTAGAIERMAELWSCRSKVKRLGEQSEEAIHESALVDKRAIKGINDVFRAREPSQESKSRALQRSEPTTQGGVGKDQTAP